MLTSDRLHREITWARHAVYWTAALLVPCLAFWWTRWFPLGPLMVAAVMVVALIARLASLSQRPVFLLLYGAWPSLWLLRSIDSVAVGAIVAVGLALLPFMVAFGWMWRARVLTAAARDAVVMGIVTSLLAVGMTIWPHVTRPWSPAQLEAIAGCYRVQDLWGGDGIPATVHLETGTWGEIPVRPPKSAFVWNRRRLTPSMHSAPGFWHERNRGYVELGWTTGFWGRTGIFRKEGDVLVGRVHSFTDWPSGWELGATPLTLRRISC